MKINCFQQKPCQTLYKLAQKKAFWIAIHAILFLIIFTLAAWAYYQAPTPGVVEKNIAVSILEGNIPYIDFECEYPPIALVIFLIPALIFRTLPAYYIAFTVEMLLFDVLAIYLIVYLSKRINISVAKSLTVYTLLMAVTAGPLVTQRYDLAPAIMVLAALAAFIAGKNKTAWGVLALGVMAKIFPVVVAPFFAIWLLLKKEYSRLVKGIAVFCGVILATILPWMIMDVNAFWTSMSYHLERGLHAESTYGSFLLLAQMFGLTQVSYDYSFASFNITSPLADSLSHNSFYIMASVFLMLIFSCRKGSAHCVVCDFAV